MPTAAPTAIPTATPVPAPTQEPYQQAGYAITIGDGVPVRQWPTADSFINETLPVNKVVYVTGQAYVDSVAWHVAEYDGKWGYVRADLLRLISEGELQAYTSLIRPGTTPVMNVTPAPYSYNPTEMSCYGYVTTDAVNFRAEPTSSSRRIRQMMKYAMFIVYGSVQSGGETWYKVSYDNQEGYLNGKYFKQMTVGEAEEFLASSKYQEGLINNNRNQNNAGSKNGSNPATTGIPSGIVSAEDQKVSEWVNPATGSTVSYEPFDPFATPAPLAENEFENNQFVNSLIDQVRTGKVKREDVKTELEKFYKDAKDPAGTVERAMEYIEGKLGKATEAPSESPEPVTTEEITEFPQEQSTGGAGGWIAAGVILAAAGGGGYYWYAQRERKRKAAQRMAQKKVAQQQKARQRQESPTTGQPASAQNAARVRTGNYTGTAGSAKPKATPSVSPQGQNTPKQYKTTGTQNPYGRYSSSDAGEDATYTASFKPSSSESRIRTNRSHDASGDDKPEA